MAARLPTVGGDDGNWGQILNDFLSKAHNSDGSLKSVAIVDAGGIKASNNLSDLVSVPVARSNLGLGASAVMSTSQIAADSAMTQTYASHAARYVCLQYGAKGDGVSDDTSAIQAAINAGPGVVVLEESLSGATAKYLVSSLTLQSGVILVSERRWRGTIYNANASSVVLKSTSATQWVIDTPVSHISNAGIDGIDIFGSVALGGVRFQAVGAGIIRNSHLNGFFGSGVQLGSDCGACTITDLLITNAVLGSVSGITGALDIDGNDHMIDRVEASCSLTALSSSNQYKVAIFAKGANCFYSDFVAEFGDRGVVVSGTGQHRFTGCRADHSYAHGWEITSGANSFAACHAIDISLETTNTYNGFQVSGTGNTFASCRVKATGSTKAQYSFKDTVSNSSNTSRNQYSACWGDYSTAMFSTDGFLGSSPIIPNHPIIPVDTTAIPDVNGVSLLSLANYATATIITNFVGGVVGQMITLIGKNTVTIANNSTIKTSTGINKVLSANVVYRFTNYNGVWYEGADALGQLPGGMLQSNRYYFTSSPSAASTNTGLGIGTLRVHPRFIQTACTLTSIGAEVTAIGDAGSLVRLVIYADNETNYPGTLVLDAGTIAGDSTGVQEIVISQSLSIGTYWFGAIIQNVTTTQPTIRTCSNPPTIDMFMAGITIPSAGITIGGYQQAAVTGAAPVTFSTSITPSAVGQARLIIKVGTTP